MKTVVSKLLEFLKYLLFIVSFTFVIYEAFITYSRLEKSFLEIIWMIIPFIFVLTMFFVTLFKKSKRKYLAYDFTAIVVFIAIIIICIRAKFDSNMLLFYKYNISFNPTFFSDNLLYIELMLYLLGFSNMFIILNKEKPTVTSSQEDEIL